MYLDEFLTRLGKENPPPAVLFTGEAEDIKVEGLSRLKAAFRLKRSDALVTYIDASSSEFLAALDGAMTASLFQESKLLICLNAQKILQDAACSSALADYLEAPSDGHTLALLSTGGRKGAKAVSALKRNAWTVECSPLAPWKAVDWVVGAASARGLSISRETAQVLLDRTGCDVTRIRQAFEILEPSIRPRTQVSSTDLDSVPLPGAEPEVFELMDALGKRKADRVIALLSAGGGEERSLPAILYQRVRELLAVAGAKQKGQSQPLVAQELGLHPFRLKNLWEQASQYQVEELKTMLGELIELQAAVITGKLGKAGQIPALEAWILRRAGKRINQR